MNMSNKPNKPTRSKAMTIAVNIGIATAALIIGFGIGWVHGYFRVVHVEKLLETEKENGIAKLQEREKQFRTETMSLRDRLNGQIKRVKQERDDISRQVILLESRRQLSLVLLNLDDRNFGIAQQHLNQTANILKGLRHPDMEYQTLTESLEAEKVLVAGNLQKQQSLFRSKLDRFDKLIDSNKNQHIESANTVTKLSNNGGKQ